MPKPSHEIGTGKRREARDHAHRRVLPQRRQERLQARLVDLDVVVHEHDRVALAGRSPGVHAAAEAHVLVHFDHVDPWVALPHHLRRAVRRGVVDDDDPVRRRLAGQVLEARAQPPSAVPGDDDDVARDDVRAHRSPA